MKRHHLRAARRLALAVMAAVALGAVAARADGFLSVIEDVPVMDGFSEITEESVAFETGDGRIAEARAWGAASVGLSLRAVRDFYAASLPALGWKAVAPGRYLREGELLIVTATGAEGGIDLRFALAPQGGAPRVLGRMRAKP